MSTRHLTNMLLVTYNERKSLQKRLSTLPSVVGLFPYVRRRLQGIAAKSTNCAKGRISPAVPALSRVRLAIFSGSWLHGRRWLMDRWLNYCEH